MKNLKLILTTTILILTNNFFAQKISLGPEVGINLIPTEKTDIGSNYQLGFHLGVQIKYHFSESFSLSSGLYATQKKKLYSSIDTTTTPDPLGGLIGGFGGFGGTGGGAPSAGGNNEAEVYTTTSGIVTELYLQMPILANYEIANINFYAGPYAGLLLSATRKEKYDVESTATDVSSFLPSGFGALGALLQPSNNEPESSTTKSKEGLATIDFGATAGIGYRVDKLNFNLFYSMGFLDYRKDKGNESIDKHNLVQFSVAYLFNIGGSKGLKNRYDLDIE